MTKKNTQRDFYNAIIATVKGEDTTITPDEIIEFAEGRIKALDEKSANRKPTKAQEEGKALKAEILEVLDTEKGMTVSEIMETIETKGVSNQRVTALLTQLVKAEEVVRTVDKKKAYYSKA
jgi:hypothetical protein